MMTLMKMVLQPDGSNLEVELSASEEAALRAEWAANAPQPRRRKVSKDLVEARGAEAGWLGDAMALLLQDPDKWRRWNARSYPWVYADDPDTIAMITAVGGDPDAALAPGST